LIGLGSRALAAQQATSTSEPQLADGKYLGYRGYDNERGAECLGEYPPFVVFIRDGTVSFDSGERYWKGSVDEQGNISILRKDIDPIPKQQFSVSGHYSRALISSGFCGSGWLRIDETSSPKVGLHELETVREEKDDDGAVIQSYRKERCYKASRLTAPLNVTGTNGNTWDLQSITASTFQLVQNEEWENIILGSLRFKQSKTEFTFASEACFRQKSAGFSEIAHRQSVWGCGFACDGGGITYRELLNGELDVIWKKDSPMVLEGCDGDDSIEQSDEDRVVRLFPVPLSRCGEN
jgi:hypothetical protein